jgi:carnosine N-methyltransferase
MASRDPNSEKGTEEERTHFQNVITAFQQYASYTVCPRHALLSTPQTLTVEQLSANNRRRKDIFALPLEDQAVIDQLGYKQKLVEVDDAILANAAFLNQIVANPEIFENNPAEDEEGFGGESLNESRGESEGLQANR